MGAGDPAQVKSLIGSIKQYKGFKNMAKYNISCLMSHITPPTVGWRENIDAAVESGAIEAIVEVMKKHPDAMEMVKCATEALSALTTNSGNAKKVAEAGGVETALGSMLGLSKEDAATPDGEEVTTAGSNLLEKVAQHNPNAILDSSGGVDAVLDGLTHSTNQRVKTACATVADRVAVSERGEQEVLKKGGIEALITAIAPDTENTEEMLKPTFRLLEKFADDSKNVKKMRDLGGVEALVHQLEAHADNEALLRQGGRLLAKVAAGDLEGAIEKLKRGGLSDKAREFTIALLANLALQPENIEKIVAQGGVKVLIDNFDQFNEKTQIAAARALGRLANNKENAKDIIAQGGVKVLVNAMKNNPDNEDLVTACTQALATLATSSLESANAVEKDGGIQAVHDGLRNHPEFGTNAQLAMQMVEQLGNIGFDANKLVQIGSVESIIGAMEANMNNAVVQRNGFRALTSLMNNASSKDGGIKTAGLAILSHKGGVDVLVNSLETHRARDQVVAPALESFATLISKESTAPAKLAKKNAAQAVVSAVYAQSLAAALGSIQAAGAMDGKFEQNVRTITSALVDKKHIASLIKSIPSDANAMCNGSEDAAEKLENSLMAVTVYSKCPELAKIMADNNVTGVLPQTLNSVSSKNSLPMHSPIMSACALATSSIGRAGNSYLQALSQNDAPDVLINTIKKHSKSPEAAICCMRALRVFCTEHGIRDKVVDNGCIEACVAAMRSNAENPMVAVAALDVFLSVASSDEMCAAVAYKGGSRQAIKMILESSTSEEFERPTERALMVLERVASSRKDNEDIRSNLIKQGAVQAVTKAMEMYPWSDTIEAIGARLLSRLIDAEGVEAEIEKLKKLVAELKTTNQKPKVLPKLGISAATVGALALTKENTPIMQNKNAAAILVDGLNTIGGIELMKEREYARRAGFRALGQIGSMAPLADNLGVTPLIMNALKAPASKVTPTEKIGVLDCVKSLSTLSSAADKLVNAGVVDTVIGLVKENSHDQPSVTAQLGALAALAEHRTGATEATKCGAVKLAMDLMRNFADTATPRFSEEAMSLLGNLALIDSNVKQILEGGAIDRVMATLDHHCSDPSAPEPRVLTAGVSLLQRVALKEDTIGKIVRRGAVGKIVQIANSSVAYQNDPECMEAILFLLETCALVKDTHEALVKSGAVDLIMSAMSLNPTNENIVVTGSKALQNLLGSSPDTVKVLLSDINKLGDQLKKKPEDREVQSHLNQALRNLANLTLVDGVVSPKAAADVAKTATDSMDTIQTSMAEGPAKQELLSAAIALLGRTPLVDGAASKIDCDRAISKLLDVIAANRNDDMVLESAMYALGNLATSPKAIRALVNGGGIELLERTINESAENERLRDAASRALDKVRAAAALHSSDLGKDKAGINALAEIIKAHQNNPAALRKLIDDIVSSKTGVNDLLAVLGSDAFKNASPEVRSEVLKALQQRLQQSGGLKITDPAILAGLLAALDEKPDGLSSADKKALLERQKDAVRMLGVLHPGSAAALAACGGVEKLLELHKNNMDDPEITRDILKALNKMAQDKNVVQKLIDMDAAHAIANMLKNNPDDVEIARDGIEILSKMAAAKGIGKIGLDAETMRLLNRVVDKFSDDKDIQKLGGRLVDGLSQIYKEDGADMIESRLDQGVLKLNAADHIRELYDDKGRRYYHNGKTGETTWTAPEELLDSMAAFEALAKLTEAHKESVTVVNPAVLRGMIEHMRKHANEPARLLPLAKTLGILAMNEENRKAIMEAGGLEAIIQALNGDNVDPEFLAAAIHLLNQFAKNDYFKEQICKLGGIEALILIMLKFMDHLQVVEKCMSTLANLAFNSKRNMAEIMKYNGVDAVQKAMSKYGKERDLLSFAMILLSNLMYGNDQNKLIIGRTCGKEIVDVCKSHYGDVKLFKGALRALGNLSYCDENILWIVQNSATKYIVAGMAANEDDLETQQIGIEVIGNFASFSEDDMDIRKKIERGEQVSVYEVIVLEGGAKRILDTVQKTEEPTLMMSGLEALSNLAHSSIVTEKLIKMGIVGTVFYAMQKYDWDEDMMERTVRLVAILTFSPEGVRAIGEHNGVQILLNAMEAHEDQPDFLANAAAALKNIAGNEKLREDIGQLGGIKTVLDLYEKNMDSMSFLLEAIALFIRLTRNEALSEQIAQRGMHILLESIEMYKDNIAFLVPVFTLLGHLAFAANNLKIIVQYGGINLIVDSILAHPEEKDLVIRCIQTLDNVAMHSPEQSKIVIEAGGDETIKEVISAYADDREVVQTGKSALLSMTQLERRKAKPKYAFGHDSELPVQSNEDPLKPYRNMLKSGIVLTEWSNGGPHSRHVYVTSDWRHIGWKDPKKSSKAESTVNLRDVRNVRSGLHDGHKKGRKQANTKHAFTIIARATAVDLEAKSEEDKERWVEALQVLLTTYKQDPKW
eukprot:CAMPEP_0203744552 /NCGR_PEP_ID=MMETSP0098-20131031/584_1 /ASSEMBLY_ACC=CAM_ASM_000208 /TAXON_ID=96639 /ORGANISM=" , Strain NY0313808BC1" /LENGTH=2433 /DNA_ID=CAMNT_0050632097 /DNA_START=311 /DNA_END=7609 /DNA_ORIENTATION=-